MSIGNTTTRLNVVPSMYAVAADSPNAHVRRPAAAARHLVCPRNGLARRDSDLGTRVVVESRPFRPVQSAPADQKTTTPSARPPSPPHVGADEGEQAGASEDGIDRPRPDCPAEPVLPA